MNLYLLCQDESNGYNTYDSAVVVAEDEISATFIHPNGQDMWNGEEWVNSLSNCGHMDDSEWADPENVTAILIGTALDTSTAPQVICASFNAG